MHSTQMTVSPNGRQSRLHESPVTKWKDKIMIASSLCFALDSRTMCIDHCSRWIRVHWSRSLTWYWNKWSNVWFASTKTSMTAMMHPNVTYRMLWMATICANKSTGSHCVFRKPDFIFIACFRWFGPIYKVLRVLWRAPFYCAHFFL